MLQRALLAESRPLTVKEADGGDGTRFRVRLITPGWGSSGYYSQEVVEAAADAKVWPAGTHMYLDHPSASEDRDRPERSVKHLAAVLESDGEWGGEGVDADVRVFSDYAEFVRERADVLGLSIRASGHIEMGEAEGRKGRIITELVESQSVDFVTRAGRGGRVLELLESALPSEVVARAVERGDVAEATVSDMRAQLAQLLRDAYGSDDPDAYVWVWLRDFDPDALTAWFEVEGGDQAGLFAHDYTAGADGALALTGTPTPVRVETSYVPVAPAADPTEESRRTPMPQIEEARLRQLETDAGRVPTLESERDTERQRADSAEQRAALLEARNTARPIVHAVLAESRLLDAADVTEAADAVIADVPLTADGQLDEAALRTAAEAARTREETRVARVLERAGVGKARGLRPGDDPTDEVTESDAEAAVAGAFGRPVKEA